MANFKKTIDEHLNSDWGLKLERKLTAAFTLDDMTPTDDGVQVDHQSYEGKPVRIHFRFTRSGKSRTRVAVS